MILAPGPLDTVWCLQRRGHGPMILFRHMVYQGAAMNLLWGVVLAFWQGVIIYYPSRNDMGESGRVTQEWGIKWKNMEQKWILGLHSSFPKWGEPSIDNKIL